MGEKILLSVVLITRNEEKRLAECLASVAFADERVIFDDFSTDATREVAEHYGARFFQRRLENFAEQKNQAMAAARGEWLLLLDADERVSPELAQAILKVTASGESADGYWLKRENHFFGGSLRYGANAGDWQLRLVRRGVGVFEGLVHERIRLKSEPGWLAGLLRHESCPTLRQYFEKLPRYTDLEAETLFRKGRKPALWELTLKPPAQFVYFYFLKLGFLDGWRGLVYQVLSSYYLFLKLRKARRLFRGHNT